MDAYRAVVDKRDQHAGRCAQNLMVAAHLPETEVAKLLKIPADVHVNRVIAFGYVDPARATAPKSVARKRKALEELVHWETWGSRTGPW